VLAVVADFGPVDHPGKMELKQDEPLHACRWWVASDTEPRDMERSLLQQLDYAANVLLNGKRRALLLYSAENTR
jgi:hypothetical protein